MWEICFCLLFKSTHGAEDSCDCGVLSCREDKIRGDCFLNHWDRGLLALQYLFRPTGGLLGCWLCVCLHVCTFCAVAVLTCKFLRNSLHWSLVKWVTRDEKFLEYHICWDSWGAHISTCTLMTPQFTWRKLNTQCSLTDYFLTRAIFCT